MLHPALTVRGADPDLLLATVDEWFPSAVDTPDDGVRIFFANPVHRDRAALAIAREWPEALVTAVDVDDEDWARRSQEHLGPVTVGRLTIVPTVPDSPDRPLPDRREPPGVPAPLGRPDLRNPPGLSLVIVPSTGFGTGHHATTRLCLAALQLLDLSGKVVLDVGTGSGILALAASALGAARAIGIDDDPEAIRAARENLALNPRLTGVVLEVGDLEATSLPAADVIAANLTGMLLQRSASRLLQTLRPSGRLVMSGLLHDERDAVVRAFASATLLWEARDDEWVGLMFGEHG